MRVALISDIHSNLPALEAVAKDIKGQGPDYIYCLGDIVGYGPLPRECIEWVQQNVAVCIAGNHDTKAFRYDDNGGLVGHEEFDERLIAFNIQAELALRHNAQTLTLADKNFLARLRRQVQFCTGLTICHGAYSNPWEYLNERREAAIEARDLPTPLMAVGHTHKPFVYRCSDRNGLFLPLADDEVIISAADKAIINVGSVGQPRDGNHRACYVILDIYANLFVCRFRRVRYNMKKTARWIRKMGIDEEIARQLVERLLDAQ